MQECLGMLLLSERRLRLVLILLSGWLPTIFACGERSVPVESTTTDVSTATIGRLMGRVRLAGTGLPTATRIDNTTDPDACGRAHTLDDLSLDAATRGVMNTFATLRPVGDPAIDLPEGWVPGKLFLDNIGCRFEPHAAMVPVGTVLETSNRDEVLHTVHLYGPEEVNLSLPIRGASIERELKLPGLYAVRCDVHGWMQAFIQVVDHPFYSLSDREGRFQIDSVPAGDYVLELWHERLGDRDLRVRIEAGQAKVVAIEYSLESDPLQEKGRM